MQHRPANVEKGSNHIQSRHLGIQTNVKLASISFDSQPLTYCYNILDLVKREETIEISQEIESCAGTCFVAILELAFHQTSESAPVPPQIAVTTTLALVKLALVFPVVEVPIE